MPAPGTFREVLDYAEADGMTPHDPGRPLWQVTLMEGLDGDRAALLLKFHHSWMDGNATIQLAQLLYDAERDADLDKPMPPPARAGRAQRTVPGRDGGAGAVARRRAASRRSWTSRLGSATASSPNPSRCSPVPQSWRRRPAD